MRLLAKACRVVTNRGTPNDAASAHTVASVRAEAGAAPEGADGAGDGAFRTDAQVAGNRGGARSPVAAGSAGTGVARPAECEGGQLSGSIGDWDQFSANEARFDVRATYDEDAYTTPLDLENISPARRAAAERMAREGGVAQAPERIS